MQCETNLDTWRAASTGGSGPVASWKAQGGEAALVSINHDSQDRFNLLVNEQIQHANLRIGVSIHADGGKIDQGGGPMWRVKDADNYYVCRYNPLESNYRVYVVHNGNRIQLATALVNAGTGWHRIEAEHVDDRITCWLNGKKLLEARDTTIRGAGVVGLCTKADAQTSFREVAIRRPGE